MQDGTTPKFIMCLNSTSTPNSAFSVHRMVLMGYYQSFDCRKNIVLLKKDLIGAC